MLHFKYYIQDPALIQTVRVPWQPNCCLTVVSFSSSFHHIVSLFLQFSVICPEHFVYLNMCHRFCFLWCSPLLRYQTPSESASGPGSLCAW